MDSLNILMTGAGAPGGPGIIKALQADPEINLFCCDADPEATGRYLCRQFHQIPRADDRGFISALLDLCVQHKIRIVFPLVTKELIQLAEHKSRFEEHGIRIIVSDKDSLRTANNKSLLYQHLAASNIPVPEFFVVNDLTSLEKGIKELGYPDREICVKPSVSNGSRGVRILSEKRDEFTLLFNEKPNHLFLTWTRFREILGKNKFPELLVSEYLPGEEYTIDTLVNKGKPWLVLPRSRSRMNNGISVKGTITRNEEIIRYSTAIIESLNLHGPIGLQVKQNSEGLFRILEINPRIQGTSVAAMGAGVNLPLLAVRQETGSFPENLKIKWGTSFSRYYSEVFHEGH